MATRIIKKIQSNQRPTNQPLPWKILIVDDDPDIHAATSLTLSHLTYKGRGIQLLHAHNKKESILLLNDSTHRDIAVALIDVVMESDDAGLQLVQYIRQQMNNRFIRLIIRTGQPGYAPEQHIIENYDIDDYKEKTELTSSKLFTMMRMSLKTYHDMMTVEHYNASLEYLLGKTHELYSMTSLQDFLVVVLAQVVGLLSTGNNSIMTTHSGCHKPDAILMTLDESSRFALPKFHCGSGRFQSGDSLPQEVIVQCIATLETGHSSLISGVLCLPLKIKNKLIGLIYLENISPMQSPSQKLLKVLNNQINAALENLWLTRQLLHTERLATLGTFSAGVAHEIKNPNSFISGNVAFLQQFWHLAAPILERAVEDQPKSQVARFLNEIPPALEGINKGSVRINTIVDSLKSYATGNRGTEKKRSRLMEPLSEARTLLLHRFKQGTELVLTVSDDLFFSCNVQEMSQVFINLFSNAMDAMDEHSMENKRTIWVTTEQDDTWLRILIKDNGPGIPKSVRNDIFNPFFTTKGPTRGTGLGLSIVKGIIENHHGRITLLDHEPPGATFELIFPILAENQAQQP
ncbi:MAG: DUF3369 domain-containing protein [Magnetococcus sp. YQC-5]